MQSVFVLYCHWRPPKLSFRWARCLTTGSVYFVFHCNNQLLLQFSFSARGITARLRARTRASWGPVLRSSKWVQDTAGKAVRYRESTARTKFDSEYSILLEKQCGAERVPSERLARPISQACTRIAVQPAVQVLASSRAPLQQMLKNLVQAGPRAPAHEVLTRKNKIISTLKIEGHLTEPSGCCLFSINGWR